MSEMERAAALLGMVPQYKLGYVIAYLQGIVADVASQDETPNTETVAALREGDEMLRTGAGQHFKGSAAEFFAMLDEEGNLPCCRG